MKKIILSVVAVMAVSVSAFAENNLPSEEMTNKYEINFNNTSIARFLHMSYDQIDDMEMIHRNFSREMKRAESNTDETKRAKAAKKAILNDVSYMRLVLNESQFRAYRTVLNATLNNRGLEY